MKKLFMGVFCFVGLLVFVIPALAGEPKVQYKVWEGKLNLNDASSAELALLEGVGNVTAHRIVVYREKAGGFKSLSQLKDVKGVSGKRFAKLEGNLTLFKESDLKVLIDVNNAPLSALEVLPGISKKLAISIKEYRERNQGFKVTEDLLKIEGVGITKFKELQNFITVRSLKTMLKEMP